MSYTIKYPEKSDFVNISVQCPHCTEYGIFTDVGSIDVFDNGSSQGVYFGQRGCPNPKCRGHIFIVHDGERVIETHPPEEFDFDPEHIPEKILKTFEEAIICEAQCCYTASAIMIRKTLEEVCQDKRITGKNLADRIGKLSEVIIMPGHLTKAMTDLRLLGNDAAHIELKHFDEIGWEEIDISLEITSEILKATYQLEDLVNRIKALKKKGK